MRHSTIQIAVRTALCAILLGPAGSAPADEVSEPKSVAEELLDILRAAGTINDTQYRDLQTRARAEEAERIDGFSKKFDTERVGIGSREHIHNAASNTKLARNFHHRNPAVTETQESSDEGLSFDRAAQFEMQDGVGEGRDWQQPLHQSRDGGDQASLWCGSDVMQCIHPAGNQVHMGSAALVRQGFPSREQGEGRGRRTDEIMEKMQVIKKAFSCLIRPGDDQP